MRERTPAPEAGFTKLAIGQHEQGLIDALRDAREDPATKEFHHGSTAVGRQQDTGQRRGV